LLHADLHHYNILAAERQAYLAIDPKGIAGDPAYEPASFLCNPVDRWLCVPDADEVILRRVQLFATRFERRRVLGWALVQSLLSAWWSFEDHGHVSQERLRFAQLFSRLCRGFEG
jgi:streptomycin 6-kinase